MNLLRQLIVLFLCVWAVQGCTRHDPQYGTERQLYWPGSQRQVWAVAPAVDLSGQRRVDPLLQADLLYQQLQQVEGVTVIPVNRVVEVYASLRIERVQSEEQAAIVCDLLGCDALLVPTITSYDPYNPPKVGAAIQFFAHNGTSIRPAGVDIHELVRRATPAPNDSIRVSGFVQAVGMFDAANGTVREAVLDYADGRNDPIGPMGSKEYFVSMDRFCGFVYHQLIKDLIDQVQKLK